MCALVMCAAGTNTFRDIGVLDHEKMTRTRYERGGKGNAANAFCV